MTAKLVTFLFLGFAATACSDRELTVPRVNSQLALSVVDTSLYLPYGVPVPVNAVLTKGPEPYDFRRHGSPAPNSMPHANAAASDIAPNRWKRDFLRPNTPPPLSDHGLRFDLPGILTRNDAQTDLVIPSSYGSNNVFIYAPATLPHVDACIESVTVHERVNNGSTRHYNGYWDHCRYDPNGTAPAYTSWGIKEPMDATWRGKYTRLYQVYSGQVEEAYYAQVNAADPSNPIGGCWHGYLYNFNTGLWEYKYESCGQSRAKLYAGISSGWSQWEQHGLMINNQCPSLKSIQAQWIRFLRPDYTWPELSDNEVRASVLGGYCWEQGIYQFTQPIGTYHWRALTPTSDGN